MKYNFNRAKLNDKEVVNVYEIGKYSKIKFEFKDGTSVIGLVPICNESNTNTKVEVRNE